MSLSIVVLAVAFPNVMLGACLLYILYRDKMWLKHDAAFRFDMAKLIAESRKALVEVSKAGLVHMSARSSRDAAEAQAHLEHAQQTLDQGQTMFERELEKWEEEEREERQPPPQPVVGVKAKGKELRLAGAIPRSVLAGVDETNLVRE